jgi:hypothetical protein
MECLRRGLDIACALLERLSLRLLRETLMMPSAPSLTLHSSPTARSWRSALSSTSQRAIARPLEQLCPNVTCPARFDERVL